MDVTRFRDAQEYQAPKHHGMTALRLQGMEASPADFAWAGMSQILPGGGADMSAGPMEKIYIVLDGEVTIVLEDGAKTVLQQYDSCYIPAGESRAFTNERNDIARMIVIMPKIKK